ncbi:hypothetical protein EXIGLDRAFT_698084 [Exidia glandulosa HHB12029]|uniref:Uncharacterized protein n=1 Tax=Exidia glandulosa HHB12029 TaxID=1314781 RepID=A0A165EG97_EXIGL|nr:hypothetical protein EXIGLDRAFT_698084 [Exidia glandulosa HHB12029]
MQSDENLSPSDFILGTNADQIARSLVILYPGGGLHVANTSNLSCCISTSWPRDQPESQAGGSGAYLSLLGFGVDAATRRMIEYGKVLLPAKLVETYPGTLLRFLLAQAVQMRKVVFLGDEHKSRSSQRFFQAEWSGEEGAKVQALVCVDKDTVSFM